MSAKKDSLAVRLLPLQAAFGERVQFETPLAKFTAARIGGPADVFLEVNSSEELARAATLLWEAGETFTLIGGGSNLLVSDSGVRGVVLLNRARAHERSSTTAGVRFEEQESGPTVWAEAGVNFGLLARLAAARGYSGLEWAGGIPGTLGGAVYGNAGAHGGDMASTLLVAEILHRDGREHWPVENLRYEYRSSYLKRTSEPHVVLGALLRLERSDAGLVQAKMAELVAFRRRTQPPGASMGSMFKNPPGDYAGRLIEAAGLKGASQGKAQISPLHANFFINHGGASAVDVLALIRRARETVAEKFGVELELEVQIVGEWGAEGPIPG
jgi:UDP-N-acetylmuramate dehydrogenase